MRRKPGERYTAIAHGDVSKLNTLGLLVLDDMVDCSRGHSTLLKFVHAAATVTNVDVWSGRNRIFKNVAYGKTGNPEYLGVPSGRNSIAVSAAGSDKPVLGPLHANLRSGKTYTLIATGLIDDSKAPIDAIVIIDDFCH